MKALTLIIGIVLLFASCKKDQIAKDCVECKFTIQFEIDGDGIIDTIQVDEFFINMIILPYAPANTCKFLDTTTNEIVKKTYISRECK